MMFLPERSVAFVINQLILIVIVFPVDGKRGYSVTNAHRIHDVIRSAVKTRQTKNKLISLRDIHRGGNMEEEQNYGVEEPNVSRSSGSDVTSSTIENYENGISVEVSISSKHKSNSSIKSAKWNGLMTRVVSTVGIILSLIGLSYFREDGMILFVVLLQFQMYREMTRAIGGADDWGGSYWASNARKYWWLLASIIAWDGPKLFPWKRTSIEAIAYGMILSTGLVGSVVSFQYNQSGKIQYREYIRQTAVSIISAILIVLPSSYWIGTLEEYGMKWIFFPAAFVAINDIMAYVFGKLFGKHKILACSPNKTLEGFVGAAIATIAAAWLSLGTSTTSKPILGPGLDNENIKRLDGMLFAVFSSLLAPFAGFLASVIKRAYGRKDFGSLLPGHGGICDRLDCQIILAPFVYFYLTLFKFAQTAQDTTAT